MAASWTASTPCCSRRQSSTSSSDIHSETCPGGSEARNSMKNLAILGSTGSIGQSALDVVRAHPDKLRVVGLAAGANADLLLQQALEFQPAVVAMASEDALGTVTQGYRAKHAAAGAEGLLAVAAHPDVDVVICASSGTAGLEAVLAAIDAGKTIALANKEVLVMAGALVTSAARERGVAILPVDSE